MGELTAAESWNQAEACVRCAAMTRRRCQCCGNPLCDACTGAGPHETAPILGVTVSVLTDDALADLRLAAMADASSFVDPRLLREAGQLIRLATDDWLSRVLGRPITVARWRFTSNIELAVMVRALKADRRYLEALDAAKWAEYRRGREEAERAIAAVVQAERDEWAALAASLPVPVEVWHNWTARHLDGYEQGADHIVVMADLRAGRLFRKARTSLCWTLSRDHQLRYVEPNVGDERRLPDCKACLRTAARLAAA